VGAAGVKRQVGEQEAGLAGAEAGDDPIALDRLQPAQHLDPPETFHTDWFGWNGGRTFYAGWLGQIRIPI
jgi:hypothetical protein